MNTTLEIATSKQPCLLVVHLPAQKRPAWKKNTIRKKKHQNQVAIANFKSCPLTVIIIEMLY